MQHVGSLAAVAGVFLLACLSPGPVWLIVTSTSVAVSRRAGILTGLGVAGATLTWATVTMLGLGALLGQLAWLTSAIKLAGAVYLVWVGVKMIASSRAARPTSGPPSVAAYGGWTALRRGYLASITNPKAAAFFGSIFVVMLPGRAPSWVSVAAVVLLAALSAAWHCGLALVFSTAAVQVGYRRTKSRVDKAIGAILIVLGVRLATSR